MRAYVLDRVDSTNDAAKRLIREGRLHGRGFVIAREQTSGRGTQGRFWLSPRDAGLYLSVVRVPAGQVSADIQTLTLAAGAACAESLEAATSLNVRIKPVNDLIVDDRKLGGILTELTIEAGEMTSLIVGIGINLCRAPRELPPDARPAVCLEELLSPDSFRSLDRPRLIERIVENVNAYCDRVLSGETAVIRTAWESRFLT